MVDLSLSFLIENICILKSVLITELSYSVLISFTIANFPLVYSKATDFNVPSV